MSTECKWQHKTAEGKGAHWRFKGHDMTGARKTAI